MKKLLAIDIQLGDGIYKLISVTIGSDGSLYFHHSSNHMSEKNLGHRAPIKFSYHKSGKNHMTFGSDEERIAKIPFDENLPLDNIQGIVNTHFGASYFDINTINDNTQMFDKSDKRTGYAHRVIIDGKNYKNLSINFAIAEKKSEKKFENKYKEVHKLELDGLDLLIGVKDEWKGTRQKT